ncbi:DUF2855 family protein [Caldimonas brevitalea]|uniref:DUF2855 domain-containing protein n=1 Tax=Caldimonas brevitalea TaxID=413882 RepID=A0A0G3BH95_9BURK|nr:DUF2855 family protein [Caldimonas brevitalea]AKJ27338.1 hypothetical protein AAW51_0647 [Caldimonas brevitalea]
MDQTPTAPLSNTRLLTRKDTLHHSRIDTQPQTLPLADGEAMLRIDRVALTTNNITYAAFGEAMQYWGFFPTGAEGWGHMPVWGFAEVIASRVPGVEPGERFYGYFPIARLLRMRPVRVTPRGFYDGAEHRLSLTSAYNQYTRCQNDPAWRPTDENYQMLLRPLFITSFMLADFLEDQNFFGAQQVVVSSASSKTAYGTAFCLADQRKVQLAALTSTRNLDFVQQLGCYQSVHRYEALNELDPDRPTLYVDFSGDDTLRSAVHHHFGSSLVYDCYAGSAHNTQFLGETTLPGPKPQFYFAPVQIRKRNADWGPAVVNQRFNEAQLRFIERVGHTEQPWMQVVEHQGFEAASRLIEALHAGRVDPREGHVVVLD